MSPVQLPPSVRSRAVSIRGGVSRTLVWALTVACVVLLIPVLIIDAPRNPSMSAEKEDAWLEFDSPEFANIVFEQAPALVITLELARPVPSDEEDDAAPTTDDETNNRMLSPTADPLRWLDGRAPPFRSSAGPNHLRYKLDPDFGIENRTLRLNGMMIRFRVEF